MKTLKDFVSAGNKFVVAHRGASAIAPENTIAAIEAAIESGAKMLETDVQYSKDGIPVVWHDDNLDKLGIIGKTVADLTYSEIEKIDAGSWFSEKFKGEKIPTLDQVLSIIKNKMYLNIEIKNQSAVGEKLLRSIINITEKHDYIEKTIFCSFYYNLLPIIKFECEEAHIAAIQIPGNNTLPSAIRQIAGIDAYICDVNELTDELAEDAETHEIFTGVYGLEDEKSIDFALSKGVVAFASDDPELTRSILIKKGYIK